jgi:hypothetical protein
LVGARGFESDDTSVLNVAGRRGNGEESATEDDETRRGVSAVPATSDEAIRVAAKVAIDVGEYERARALLDLLEVRPRAATVVPLPLRRGRAGEEPK